MSTNNGMVQLSRVAYEAQQAHVAKLLKKVQDLEQGKPTTAPIIIDGAEEIAALKAKVAQLEAATPTPTRTSGLSFKVGEKGGISIYGLGRFPVTLSQKQLLLVLSLKADIFDFITAHDSELKAKPVKE